MRRCGQIVPAISMLMIASGILSCAPDAQTVPSSVPSPSPAAFETAVLETNQGFTTGATLYVPIYSHIYFENEKSLLNLTATLSIRNTDFEKALILRSVRYYDSEGNLVRQYLQKPIQVDAMASKEFVISRADKSGGAGANFIVDWASKQPITEPVVEAIMIGTEGNRGFSFVSSAKEIKRLKNANK